MLWAGDPGVGVSSWCGLCNPETASVFEAPSPGARKRVLKATATGLWQPLVRVTDVGLHPDWGHKCHKFKGLIQVAGGSESPPCAGAQVIVCPPESPRSDGTAQEFCPHLPGSSFHGSPSFPAP
ncbi:PDZ and LIM domain protein 7 [Platysternon megacephalum]|uniref:PDZ and LIM domain protein 7 n=1 Tax=Platysternon megacephalum TaxID=55544 RepID=A0A4D9DKS5_9SAUR|nr:PDZ and LIM domain protein 7 [Platysternon megacephalum]